MRLLLGTRNRGKIVEIKRLFHDLPKVELLTWEEVHFSPVEETGESFLENALLKARRISAETGLPVLAEDAGLEVEALGGRPGVRSARFAGEEATDRENIQKLLTELSGVENRRARFRAVAVVRFPEGKELIAEGELRGTIAAAPRGHTGFGYDPVFIPEGFNKTLAELGLEVKNRISHRAQALRRLKELLRRELETR